MEGVTRGDVGELDWEQWRREGARDPFPETPKLVAGKIQMSSSTCSFQSGAKKRNPSRWSRWR